MKTKESKLDLYWFITHIVILILAPVAHYISLDRQLDYEYATGIRTDTGGDTIHIPVFGGFVFLLVLMLLINVIAVVVRAVYRKRNRNKSSATHI